MKIRVKEVRQAVGVSQGELAEAAHVSRQTINSVENGRSLPNVMVAIRMARALNTDVESLFVLKRARSKASA